MSRLEAAFVFGSLAIALGLVSAYAEPAPTVPACRPVEVRVVYDSREERESDLWIRP